MTGIIAHRKIIRSQRPPPPPDSFLRRPSLIQPVMMTNNVTMMMTAYLAMNHERTIKGNASVKNMVTNMHLNFVLLTVSRCRVVQRSGWPAVRTSRFVRMCTRIWLSISKRKMSAQPLRMMLILSDASHMISIGVDATSVASSRKRSVCSQSTASAYVNHKAQVLTAPVVTSSYAHVVPSAVDVQ